MNLSKADKEGDGKCRLLTKGVSRQMRQERTRDCCSGEEGKDARNEDDGPVELLNDAGVINHEESESESSGAGLVQIESS